MNFGTMMAFTILFWQADVSVLHVRDAYFRTADNKRKALNFEQMLDSIKDCTLPVLICYKGAAEMIKARNADNPIHKYACFTRGKLLIEKAIATDTSNVECRFIRYSIQRNLPGFLNYNKNLKADKLLMQVALDSLKDMDLKNRIAAYLKISGKRKNNEQDHVN